MALVLLAHALVIAWLPSWDERDRTGEGESALQVDFIERPLAPEPVIIVRAPSPPKATTLAGRPRPTAGRPKESTAPTPTAESPPLALTLYGSDGRVRLSDEVMAEVDRSYGDKRQFDFQVPGLDEGRKLLDRPPALTYEATRFDQYYRPNKDLLTDILTRAVEATTRQITLPMPGNPGKKIVCSVSLLALGGGCGIADNRNGYYVRDDDPATLSAEEDRQCQAWWDKIIGAGSQEAWRDTRALYEQQCRKPLERKPPQPEASDRP